ncbi:MAG: hypothetical protein UU48_C0003G0007 [Candidatus Uhrbacteria bacterium GW2011_GWF2_41_16]|uniref:Uncharacterized protein n=2 Tax=Candidatus Uhriibacteriota TaxID=1752732 RepID=A0A0G0VFA8_9BACT|nr:MAG: hypothetical protein UU35_C0003G0007 [Candidatus Uhrbacteria bacterium GW2011_GWC2_41_11]KKR98336.1 MAG: hypothetical protein UU48_C0003G0007 [Candidatus Uhrbacteria bacterium GW2011_GWF2_41_16]HBP00059.1 hypothetical protein [Candidatus Uhrbacteria bacterium]
MRFFFFFLIFAILVMNIPTTSVSCSRSFFDFFVQNRGGDYCAVHQISLPISLFSLHEFIIFTNLQRDFLFGICFFLCFFCRFPRFFRLDPAIRFRWRFIHPNLRFFSFFSKDWFSSPFLIVRDH